LNGIKQRLKQLRQVNGLTMAEFSARIQVSPGNVGDWESEKRSSTPGTKALIAIAEQFNVSLDWLLLGKQPGQPRQDTDSAFPSPATYQLAALLHSLSAADAALLMQVARRIKSYTGED